MRDDGVLFICDLINTSENGDMPHEILQKVSKHWFENRYVGYGRQYSAMGVNQQVDLLCRFERDESVRIGQFALMGNGEQFRIDNVSHGQEENPRLKQYKSDYYRTPVVAGLKYTEVTLSRLESFYDVATE